MLPLTFLWLAAFPLGFHQKGSPIFHMCTKTSHFLPWTAPTAAPWCSGGFAHWWCPGVIIFTFRYWHTRKKERWHCYISTSLTLHAALCLPRSITIVVLVELLLNPFTMSESRGLRVEGSPTYFNFHRRLWLSAAGCTLTIIFGVLQYLEHSLMY